MSNGTSPTIGKPIPARHNPTIIKALRNFAISISVFNIFGYTVLGFEQPWSWPFVALFTAYAFEMVLEAVSARVEARAPRFTGNGVRGVVEFLYPSHITALAMNMLIYVNDRVYVMIFGVLVAVGAKWVLRAPVRGKLRHFMNPSNFGIAVILILFPWASIAPPYEFTERVGTTVDWIVPGLVLIGGTMLNAKLTGRMWLIAGWLSVYVVQAVFRGLVLDTSIPAALIMMTGVAFVLYTNYMVTDPGTSPSAPGSQFAFGGGIAVVYGFFTGAGIAYGLFFATAVVCAIRGGFLWALYISDKARAQRAVLDGARSGDATAGTADPTDSAGKKVVTA
ncbi:enediyne biosynthesis protein [Actinomadura sp. BRA 177]|uniref:enediyne biosynthesis protein n=1 Tax=Actinomadura sp. BRA 177 TaxID=2745202 RepID=UPI001595C820|nr:enediyne biosynthesis protein [Actinomadura sp. BRA 177]NVI88924.1 enediyne biosynthesis protein [Actinomadura sp. BRA 177]